MDCSGLATRRGFLAAAAGALSLLAWPRRPGAAEPVPPGSGSLRSWTRVFGSRDRSGEVVTIREPVRLDRDVTVAGLVITGRGELIFDPAGSVTLTSSGNVVVLGELRMAPDHHRSLHRLRFVGIDESRFVGGGSDPLRSDVGLWVHGRGRLALAGAPRTAWVRAAGSVPKGASRIRLRQPPVGWRAGDELVVTPTASPDRRAHSDRFDRVRVVAVHGDVVTVHPPMTFAHPAHHIGRGTVVSAEILNLTRNVQIEGRRSGRTHVHLMSSVRQDLRHFSVRHAGPRQATGERDFTAGVVGRYAVHFHAAGDASRGSVVEGAVVRDCGSHAYVPHASHGITFRSCISHDTMDDAYWWDGAPDTRTPQVASHQITYDSCVASRVRCDPEFRGQRLTGFSLGQGVGSRAVDCVAVGIQGNKSASGFLWPEGADGVWEFSDCVSHNNAVNGLFVWQNSGKAHRIRRFVAFHNGGAGIEHGAYSNGYRYANSILYGNRRAAVAMHAVSASGQRLVLDNLHCDGAGISAYGIEFVQHNRQVSVPTLVSRSVLTGHRVAGIGLTAVRGPTDVIDVVDCRITGNAVRAAAGWVGGKLRWTDAGRGTVMLGPLGSPGVEVERWGVVSRPIRRFTAATRPPPHVSLTPIAAAPAPRARAGVAGTSARAVLECRSAVCGHVH